jgi:hypothetical protein
MQSSADQPSGRLAKMRTMIMRRLRQDQPWSSAPT